MADFKLSKFSIKGFKSIRETEIKPGGINVCIGPNGAGKSNLIAFFRLLSWNVKSVDRFQDHIASLGFASSILFDGPKTTKEIEGLLEIETSAGYNEYFFRLVYTSGDQLFFGEEKVRFSAKDRLERNPNWTDFGFGHQQSKMPAHYSSDRTVKVINNLLKGIFVYQFHNTTQESEIRNSWSVHDGRYLKENAANLGAFLFNLQQNHSQYYLRIVKYIRQILPFFDNFVLDNEGGRVLLRWREIDSQMDFHAGQASDGMLRFIALVSLLAQPPKQLPPVMFIDEPELGLHPAAISMLAGLIKKASTCSQVFISTQSVNLVNEFEPGDLIIVDRKGRGSSFTRKDPAELDSWLEEFTLGELWEKNLLGGRP